MNANEIYHAILDGKFTMDELRSISTAVKAAYDSAQRNARREFRVGDRVRTPRYGDGVVESIGPKNIIVRVDKAPVGYTNKVRCSPSLLTKVA